MYVYVFEYVVIKLLLVNVLCVCFDVAVSCSSSRFVVRHRLDSSRFVVRNHFRFVSFHRPAIVLILHRVVM